MRYTLFTMLTRVLATIALAVATLGAPALADTLHLKDGRVIEGRIDTETDAFVYFIIKVGSIERGEYFLKEQIQRIERSEKAEATPEPARPTQQDKRTTTPRDASPGAIRVAFITLGEPGRDMVGTYMNAEALKRSFDLLERDEPDIVVLEVASGGGYGLEVQKLSDVIENHFKNKYRTVAWINSAISAAAMTAITCNEIYFMSRGNFGAATGYYPAGPGRVVPVSGRELEEDLYEMEKISARGGYDPLIMRAMQVHTELSCDIDADGVVHWRNDLKGQHIVSTKDRILTFNSRDAVRFKFARGIADTRDELVRQLVGNQEWVEVGQAAAAYQYEYRAATHSAELALNRVWRNFMISIQAASRANDQQERNRQVGMARRSLAELRSHARRSSGVAFYFGLNDDLFRELEDILRRIANGERVELPF